MTRVGTEPAEHPGKAGMTCPRCDFEGSWRPLHRHLADAHPDLVSFEERSGRRVYLLSCPQCGASYEQTIKPRLNDPEFVAEFENEIRLVALDMLLHHLVGEHFASQADDRPVSTPTDEVS